MPKFKVNLVSQFDEAQNAHEAALIAAKGFALLGTSLLWEVEDESGNREIIELSRNDLAEILEAGTAFREEQATNKEISDLRNG